LEGATPGAMQSIIFKFFRAGLFPRDVWLDLVNFRKDGLSIDAPLNWDQCVRIKEWVKKVNSKSPQPTVQIEDIPDWVLECMRTAEKRDIAYMQNHTSLISPSLIYLTDLSLRMGQVGNDRGRMVLPYQLEGASFGIQRQGRCLIADEMGLGKTLQALIIAYQYNQTDWPCLIICPSSIRFVWKEQITRWLGGLINPATDVQVITKGKDEVNRAAKIVIVPYTLLEPNPHLAVRPGAVSSGIPILNIKQKKHSPSPYQCVICDESHYIKDPSSKRSKAVQGIIKKSKRVILISGTPSMNNAEELYPQIAPLLATGCGVKISLSQYRDRYCISSSFTPKNSAYSITRWSGAQYKEELNALLSKTIMIRRMKKDVVTQLPEKRRQRIELDPGSAWSAELRRMTQSWLARTNGGSIDTRSTESLETMELWRATGAAKLQSIKDYVSDLFRNDSGGFKCILFAHHQFVMDGIEDSLENHIPAIGPGSYIRIDGKTSQEKRASLVADFQSNRNCRVALLSITSCCEGITLTAANLVLFCELYWVPGIMEQAEARAHRVGQKDCVFCNYLIFPESPDDVVFNMLEKKKRDTSQILDGIETGLELKTRMDAQVPPSTDMTQEEIACLLSDDSQWISTPGEVDVFDAKRQRTND